MTPTRTIAIVLLGLGLATTAGAYALTPNASAGPAAVVGTEVARPGCEFENGFNVCNHGEAAIKDTYLQFH